MELNTAGNRKCLTAAGWFSTGRPMFLPTHSGRRLDEICAGSSGADPNGVASTQAVQRAKRTRKERIHVPLKLLGLRNRGLDVRARVPLRLWFRWPGDGDSVVPADRPAGTSWKLGTVHSVASG